MKPLQHVKNLCWRAKEIPLVNEDYIDIVGKHGTKSSQQNSPLQLFPYLELFAWYTCNLMVRMPTTHKVFT